MHLATLRTLMDEERLYQQSGLTLPVLASAVGVSPQHLSEIINTKLGLSFYDFVNGYRVEEVKASPC